MGIIDDIKNYKGEYKELTVDTIRKAMHDIFGQNEEDFNRKLHGSPWPVGKLNKTQEAMVRSVYPAFMIEGLGEELYHIGGGVITGTGGWEQYNTSLRNTVSNDPK